MKKTGTSSTVETSPRRKRAQQRKRQQQEAAWAAKSGPVTVRRTPAPAASDSHDEAGTNEEDSAAL